MHALLRHLLMIAFATTLGSGTTVAQTITIGVEETVYLPEYSWDGTGYTGFGAEVLSTWAADRGHEIRFEAYPVRRLFQELVNRRIDLKYPDNPYWSADMKSTTPVVYSDPVVRYIDGILVRPDRLGKGIDSFNVLGKILGFTAPAWLPMISSGRVAVVETANYSPLVQQALRGRIDGLYGNISVANFELTRLGLPGALVFDPDLPHTDDFYRLSTVDRGDLIEDFNSWMRENADKLTALKRTHGVGFVE